MMAVRLKWDDVKSGFTLPQHFRSWHCWWHAATKRGEYPTQHMGNAHCGRRSSPRGVHWHGTSILLLVVNYWTRSLSRSSLMLPSNSVSGRGEGFSTTRDSSIATDMPFLKSPFTRGMTWKCTCITSCPAGCKDEAQCLKTRGIMETHQPFRCFERCWNQESLLLWIGWWPETKRQRKPPMLWWRNKYPLDGDCNGSALLVS